MLKELVAQHLVLAHDRSPDFGLGQVNLNDVQLAPEDCRLHLQAVLDRRPGAC